MKTSGQITNTIKNWINNNSFEIVFTTMSNSTLVRQKIGAYYIEFTVYYNQVEKNYRSADWYQPQEVDIKFVPESIDDLCIYINNKICDISEIDLEVIKNWLYWSIVHKK
jgi:hypothetical protein